MATPALFGVACPLLDKIAAIIQSEGPMDFARYMEMALYDPDHGYYATDRPKVGKEGDFITSVSVGQCFGLILARRLHDLWAEMGEPDHFGIIEPGSHDGALCADILGEIRSSSPRFFAAVKYHLVEATARMRNTQQDLLDAKFSGKYICHDSLKNVRVSHGALLSNELIDAFPVDLVEFNDGHWWQIYVDLIEDELQFIKKKPSRKDLLAFCRSLGKAYPEGYRTEFCPGITRFTQEASEALAAGLMITIDYGFEAGEYYHPSRTGGTLQTYYNHTKSEDPLAHPGNSDITCHVDFTRITEQSIASGFSSPSLSSQASYLTRNARAWLLGLEESSTDCPDTRSLLRQFQTLTHPSMFGGKFRVLEMKKNAPCE